MNCREWEEAIALYAAGDLDAQRRLAVERHLGACPGCQIFASGMLECLEAMRAGHRQEIAEAHFTAVRARVLTKLQTGPWWRSGWLRAGAAAVVACAVFWLAMVSWNLRKPTAAPQVAFVRPAVPEMAPGLRPRSPLPYGRGSDPGRRRARQQAEERNQAVADMVAAQAAAVISRPAGLPARRRRPAPSDKETLTVRIVTDDPDVVIYWITNPKGE